MLFVGVFGGVVVVCVVGVVVVVVGGVVVGCEMVQSSAILHR